MRFQIGDVVEALQTCQGMTRGEQFSVKDYDVFSTPFGNFVTYKIANTGQTLEVRNAHLLMRKVPPPGGLRQ